MTELLLTQDDDGRTIEAAVGDLIVVELPENPTTGFRWISGSDPRPILDIHADLNLLAGEAFGALGVRRLEFLVVEVGETLLRLSNRQEWEPEVAATATYSITIVARN